MLEFVMDDLRATMNLGTRGRLGVKPELKTIASLTDLSYSTALSRESDSENFTRREKAMSTSSSSSPSTTLKAEYATPTSSQNFSHPLPSCAAGSTTKEKSAYLSTLRVSIVRLQDEVNTFLTERMKEDKVLASLAGVKGDDRQEEENYGEEIADEEK